MARVRCTAVAAAVALALAAPAAAAPPLFPVRKDGKWGFIDREGKLVIAPAFERAGRFSEGLAPVVLAGRHGYVDATGRMVLAPEQAPAGDGLHRPFVDGRAAVRVGDRVGYLDREGKLVVAARFTAAQDFSEGFAFACDASSCGYIDAVGRPVVAAGLVAGRPVRNGVAGFAPVSARRGPRRYVLQEAKGGRLPGEYDDVGSLSEGLVAVRHEGRWGYVDRGGRPVIQARFARAGEFSEGLAPVAEQAWTCGYADASGKLVIAPRFRLCYPFSNGLARVEILGPDPKVPLAGFVDRTGALKIDGRAAKPPFETADDFVDGLAAVRARGEGGATRLGYVDAVGRYVWPLTQ